MMLLLLWPACCNRHRVEKLGGSQLLCSSVWLPCTLAVLPVEWVLNQILGGKVSCLSELYDGAR